MGTYQRPTFAEERDIQQDKILWIQLSNDTRITTGRAGF